MRNYRSLSAAGLLLAVLFPAFTHAQFIPLSSTWIQHDPQETENVQPNGLLDLTGQSASGFTATVRTNDYAPAYPARSQYLPRIVQTFPDQPMTNLGSRVTVSFDVVFNTLPPDPINNVDVGFRMSLGDTNANNAILGGFEFGPPSGTVILLRYDTTITQDTNYLDLATGNYIFGGPYVWSSICDGGGNLGSSSTAPNGLAMATDTTNTHHIRFSVERVPTSLGGLGLQVDAVWSNSGGTEITAAAGAPIPGGNGDDFNGLTNVKPWTNINCFALCLFGTASRQPFLEGTYTVSNFKAYYGFQITDFQKNGSDEVITWESTPVDVCQYIVETSSNLSNWSAISTNLTEGFATSFTNSAPPSADARFYRVLKQF
jgi:hypothetical protein